MGEVTDQQLVYEINGPEDPMDEQQDPIVVIMPADHQRIEAKDEIEDGVSAFHACLDIRANITKKGPVGPLLYVGDR